jgi:carboxymethylenebutenolidase
MPDIKIAAADGGSFSAYLARPAKTPAPGILLIQEIFGVNKVMRDLADGYAKQGYIVTCPDLFWRIEPGVQITDKSQAEWDKAFDLMNKFLALFEKGVADLQATIAHLRGLPDCSGKVGVVGYCLGGSLAYACATNPGVATDASVGYYPVQIDDYLSYAGNIDKPALFHIAEKDGFCPPESQAKIKEALGKNPNCTVHSYAGVDHAFAREGGANFSAEAARLANERTAAFFKKNLG